MGGVSEISGPKVFPKKFSGPDPYGFPAIINCLSVFLNYVLDSVLCLLRAQREKFEYFSHKHPISFLDLTIWMLFQ